MANTLYEFYTGQGQKLPSISERSKIYETAGLGTGYQGTAQQNTALLGYLKTPQTPQTPKAEIPATIDATSMTKIPEPIIPQMTTPEQAVDTRAQAMGAIGGSTVDFYNNLLKAQQTPTQTETQTSSLTEELKKQMEAGLGRGRALVDAQTQLGVPKSVKQLQDVNLQLAQTKEQFDLAQERLRSGTGLTNTISGKSGQVERERAIRMGALATTAQALQGNIQLAKQTAQETVDLKYADIEQQIANTKTLLELNYDQMSREDKKKADELNVILNARQEAVEEQKLTDTGIQNIMIQAAENGADQDTLQKISQSTNVQKAIQNAGAFMMTPTTKETNAPVKIGQNSKGEDIFFYGGKVVTGNGLLGDLGGGINDIIAQTFDNEAYNNAIAIRDGQLKLTDIKDTEMQQRVLNIQKTLPPSESAINEAESMISKLETILNHPGLDSAVGPTPFTRGMFAIKDVWGNRDAFLGLANQVISSKALNELIEAKGKGATFGALSDTEMAILRAASTALGGWERTKDGRLTKFDVDEKSFKTEVNKLITEYRDLVDRAKDPLQLFPENNPVVQTVTKIPDGEKGGQCGRFVNKLTGLGLGDSYQSKMAKMDPSLTFPEPGMVFVMPYKDTGHTGFIVGVNDDGTVTVKDSNWGLDETVKTRTMPISKITGLARV
jgi:hypothetical protein